MPVYTYEMLDNMTGTVYAENVFEAEEIVFSRFGEHPERVRETE